jgi:hypothetical protein
MRSIRLLATVGLLLLCVAALGFGPSGGGGGGSIITSPPLSGSGTSGSPASCPNCATTTGNNSFTGTNTFTTPTSGDSSALAATTQFVAYSLAALNPAQAANEATTTALPNTPTYNNGTSGVGATLTAGANAALTVDGVAVSLNDRVLVKNQASAFQNGIYAVTATGSASAPWVPITSSR